jgi:transcriptional/translational regulatory protein YebC/TACO1
MEVRTILTKNGAQQGVVGFLFQRRGVIRVRLPDGEEGVGVDELLEKLLEVEGFEDFGDVGSEEGIVPIFSEPSAVKAVADAVESLKGVEVVQMQISWVPGDLVDASGEDVALVDDLVEKLEEVTEVQEVCLNMRRPEQEPDLRATL